MNYTGNAEAQTQEIRLPEINRELDSLAGEIKMLDERLLGLENKLMPVLSQNAEASGSDQKNPESVRVPLAQSIYDEMRHVANCNARLVSILNRLEI